MEVSQLYYTWADKGLQGRARFQFVAATRTLAGGPVPLQAVRAGLCGFPGVPQGEEAGDWVSVGWLDIGPTRIAFWRADSGRDGAGRPGNFRAHLLIGDAADLPGTELCHLFEDTTFWWSQDPESSRKLPSIAQIKGQTTHNATWTTSAQTVEALARILDAKGRTIGFAADPRAAMEAVAVLASVLPELVEARNISTYETPDNAARFDLVGVTPNARLRPPTDASRLVAAHLCQLPRVQVERLGAILRSAGAGWGSLSLHVLPLALAHRGQALGWEDFAAVANRYSVARELCLYPGGRSALTAGLLQGEPLARSLVLELFRDPDIDLARMMARVVLVGFLKSGKRPPGFLCEGEGAVREGLVDALLDFPDAACRLAADLSGAIVTAALARSGVRWDERRELREALVARAASLCCADPGLPLGAAWPAVAAELKGLGQWSVLGACLAAQRSTGAGSALRLEDWPRVLQASSAADVLLLWELAARQLAPQAGEAEFWKLVSRRGSALLWRHLRSGGSIALPIAGRHPAETLELLRSRARREISDPAEDFLLPRLGSAVRHAENLEVSLWHDMLGVSAYTNRSALRALTGAWGQGLETEAAWSVARLLHVSTQAGTAVDWAEDTIRRSGLDLSESSLLVRSIALRGCRHHSPTTVRNALTLCMRLIDRREFPMRRLGGGLADRTLQEAWESITPSLLATAAVQATDSGDVDRLGLGSRWLEAILKRIRTRQRQESPTPREDSPAIE